MMVNQYVLIVVTLLMTFITNYVLKLSFLKGGIITVTIITLAYIVYISKVQKKRYTILENDLDPETFIQASYKDYKNAGKNKQLNSLFNMDLAFGYMSLGEYERALEFLLKVQPEHLPRVNKAILTYYNALMIVYYNLDDYEKANEVYEKVEKYKVKGKLGEQLMDILMANKYYYEGNYDASKKRFDLYPKDKISKRLELEILFLMAKIDEKEGKIKNAISKYERVAKEGNKLNSSILAKEKIQSIN